MNDLELGAAPYGPELYYNNINLNGRAVEPTEMEAIYIFFTRFIYITISALNLSKFHVGHVKQVLSQP